MAKEMRMVTATHRHCCAMPGCMNRTYTYFTRRDNPAGAVWLCGDCVQAMNNIVCPPVADQVEIEPETAEISQEVEPEDPVSAEEPAKPRRGKGKNA